MYTIFYDESGQLESGFFYQLTIPFILDDARQEQKLRGRIVKVAAGDYPTCYMEVLYDATPVRRCALNAKHILKYSRSNYSADLFAWGAAEQFVCDSFGLVVAIVPEFARALKASPFRGYETVPLPIRVNQTSAPDPELYVLVSKGADCVRPRGVRIPTPNCCPFCRKTEVVCKQCLHVNHHCLTCKRRLLTLESERARKPAPFLIEDPPERGGIIDGKLWDGSDFIDGADQGVITGRVLDWLLARGATSFIATDWRVDVSQMKPDMRRKLDEVRSKRCA